MVLHCWYRCTAQGYWLHSHPSISVHSTSLTVLDLLKKKKELVHFQVSHLKPNIHVHDAIWSHMIVMCALQNRSRYTLITS